MSLLHSKTAQASARTASASRIGAFTSVAPARRAVRASAQPEQATSTSRREMLQQLALVPALAVAFPQAALAAPKAPSGFTAVLDQSDNYQFLYPFGWQEVTVGGADVVFKDVVEPLESVSVTITPTDRKAISEFGTAEEVSETLATKVLTAPGSDVKLIASSVREGKGKEYYDFEFTVTTPRYVRHQLATVVVNDGKFYTLTTGANERRWGKMKERLEKVIKSFSLIN